MTYPDAIQFLYDLRLFGTKMGLEHTRRLSTLAGNPHQKLRFIHVAGTNGKGSTCALLENIYRNAGLKTGLYTSPHLVSFRERIQVRGHPISEQDVVRLVGTLSQFLVDFPKESCPTFFEVVTVMALQYFAEQQCDIVIWETGLGGRLDATNIVLPLATVITTIDLDHEKWLGATLAEIAAEKAGIIKPGIPVITGETKLEPLTVIRETAARHKAPLLEINRPLPELQTEATITGAMPLLGEHQRRNAALAAAVARSLADQIPVSDDVIQRGLYTVHWPGRFQVVNAGAGRTIILDGAHNPAGVDALKSSLTRYFPGQAPAFILGVMEDKNWKAICDLLVPMAAKVWFVPVSSERTANPASMREYSTQLNPTTAAQAAERLDQAIEALSNDPLVVITGSLHLIGQAIEVLRLAPAPERSERELNDWQANAAKTHLGRRVSSA